jgi:hypothetical protein
MPQDSVSVAFDIILEELDSVVTEVNAQGAAHFRGSEYDKAEACISSAKKLKAFERKLSQLRDDWSAGLDEPTRKKVAVKASSVRAALADEASRRPKTILIVKMADGTVYFENKASETFTKVIRKLGVEAVAALGLHVRNTDLISKTRSEYSQAEADGYLILTHSSTDEKRDLLLEIASRLRQKIVVEVVPAREA